METGHSRLVLMLWALMCESALEMSHHRHTVCR